MSGTVLFVDDDREMRALVEQDLGDRGYRVSTARNGHAALAMLEDIAEPDAVITDLRMPSMTGNELCRQVRAQRPDLPVIVLTAFGTMDAAVEALRAGAYDFVTKPVELDLLAAAVGRAVRQSQLTREVQRLGDALRRRSGFGRLSGESSAMRRMYEQLGRLASTDVSVLVSGESGTGKELVARGLHQSSPRVNGPFVAVNCSALPEHLLESELFGHARGAFTGAREAHVGLFVQAHGGTLFLDEVGELPLPLQPKLLRALEDRIVRPVGGSGEIPFDVRLVAATNLDLEQAVEEGAFRADLYYRLAIVELEMPPLRERGTDALLLAQEFIDEFGQRHGRDVKGITDAAARLILDYPWPGNVRELRNAIERAVALTNRRQLGPEDFPERVRARVAAAPPPLEPSVDRLVPLEVIEARYIRQVLDSVGGNKSLAARILAIDRKTLRKRLRD